jgi:hypothetical protein
MIVSDDGEITDFNNILITDDSFLPGSTGVKRVAP